MEMRMEMGVWGSQKGQGATWMHWSDMMELKLINGCCTVCLGGIQERGDGQMEGAEWI